MLFLSIDFGTSSVKMSIIDENMQTKCWSRRSYPYVLLPGEKNELREEDLMNAFFSAADELDPELRKK